MIEGVMRDLPQESPVRSTESFRRYVRFRALKNIRIIEADHAPMTGGMDFSAHGVKSRYEAGYKAVDTFFARQNPSEPPAASRLRSRDAP